MDFLNKDILISIAVLAVVIFVGQFISNWFSKKLGVEGV